MQNLHMSRIAPAKTLHGNGLRLSAAPQSEDIFSQNGYAQFRVVKNQMCALKQFNYTSALVVGLEEMGYQRRYCYEHRADAENALVSWDGRGHPS